MFTSRLNRLGCGLLLTMSVTALADPSTADPKADGAAPAVAQPHGLIPVPDYTGDLWTRNRLTGDWGGTRTDLANKGIQFEVNFNQTVQSVVDGGRDRDTEYGGSLDYILTLDLMRMGIMPGAMIKFRGESRYGNSVNGIAGPILPVNTDASFPFGDGPDDDIAFTLTNLTYVQFFSEHFGIVLGKVDTLDSDPNEFASGRGTSQFMNANLIVPAAPLLIAPAYSTLAAGFMIMPVKGITISNLFINAADSSTTTGFEDFGEGTTWITEVQFQYRLGALPGGFNVSFGYSFDNNFLDLDSRFIFEPGQGIAAPTKDESWAFFASLWQYLYVEAPIAEGLVNIHDGQQDHQGVGFFLRVGFADDDTNPLEFALSAGLGAKGLIPGRDQDTAGVGYFFGMLEAERFTIASETDDEIHGFEAYYNLAITPAARLTFDIQVAESVKAAVDTAVILGLRLNLAF